jgi:hypothetical protein
MLLCALDYAVAEAQTAPTQTAPTTISSPAPAQSAPSPGPAAGPTTDRTGGAPAPAVLATPAGWDPLGVKGLTLSGTVRAYDFNRLNAPEYNAKGAATGPNRAAFNFGGDLRADYRIGNTPFAVGGAVWGSDPFGLNGGTVGCNVGAGLIVQQPQALCAKNNAGIDNTLPGFALETFEYYLKFTDKTAAITVGNQLLNKPWLPAGDSRIKPALYQGLDATINLTPALSVGLTDVTRFEDRTESTFSDCTLLSCTSTPAGVGSGGVFGAKTPNTTGADRAALIFKPNGRFTISAENYWYHNIADLTYVESKYSLDPSKPYNPFLGVQLVNENSIGTRILGKILNQTLGAQLGANVAKNVVLSVGADYAPWNYDTVVATSAAAASAAYFVPGGGTNTLVAAGINASPITAVKVGPDLYRVTYGGIVSPYTDSYADDPLYTTSISQGMVDRRSAGFAYKGALTFTTANKRFVAVASEAAYDYDTTYVRNRTYEFDADVTYDFNAVRAGAYKGFSIRERFADRTQPTLPYNFKYLRHQLQYSF